MKKLFKWIKEHMRPYAKYRPKEGKEIDLKKDNAGNIVKKAEEQTEVGIKFTFKF